jgi:hypothetical protein
MRFSSVGLGLGRAARLYHQPASLTRVSGATAVGGADDVAETRVACQEQTGLRVFELLEELLAPARPDARLLPTSSESLGRP